ncbi:MAG: restriction endonuclease [Chloroflexota bacterium]
MSWEKNGSVGTERVLRDDQSFELQVKSYFEHKGYRVKHTPWTRDEGYDLECWHPRERKVLVECKRYTDKRVTIDEIRAFYGVLTKEGADKGYFITTSSFTKGARSFVETLPPHRATLNLVDGAGGTTVV